MDKEDGNEVIQFRQKFNEKVMDDMEFQQVEKEKHRALFTEMVRLGEQSK